MDHLVLRAGRRGVLIADVAASADGHGIGYGIMLKRLDKALWYAQTTGLSLFLVRESAINRVIFRLESDDVRIVPRGGLRGLLLTAIWLLAAPFRVGSPRLTSCVTMRSRRFLTLTTRAPPMPMAASNTRPS